MQYIGETGHSLQTGKREHERSVKGNKVEQSALHGTAWESMHAACNKRKPMASENMK